MKDGVLVGFLVIVAGTLSMELGFSTAILEVLAGVLGSNILLLHDMPWLEFLSNFGLLGLMFFAGFETDMEMLARHYKKSLSIGFASFFVPFILTLLGSLVVLRISLQPSLLIAISMSTTSLALVYPVLKERGILKQEHGQTLLTSAMVVDILSMFMLSLIFLGFTKSTLAFILVIFPCVYILPRIGRRLFRRYKKKKIVEFEVRFLLLIMLSFAFFAESVGIHAAVMAFVVGLFWNELFLEDRVVEDKLRGVVFGFLAPLFFFKAGMAIELRSLTTSIIPVIIFLTLLAYGGKRIGTSVFIRGVRTSTRRFVSLLFNLRLTFGVVTALLGLSMGIISREIYTAILCVVLITATLSSILLKIVPHEII